MKTLLLARPDHSTFLYEGLRKNSEIDINYHTFSAFKKGSFLNKWKPSVKSVDSEVEISYGFTAFHRLLDFLNKHIAFDYYGKENQISEYFFHKILQNYSNEVNIIHYWPTYCYHSIKNFKQQNPQTKLLADVYAAHPHYVHEILEPEFDKYGLSFQNSYFIKSSDRDLEALEGVKNILVPSKYMAEMYQKYYPNMEIFDASFGLLSSSIINAKPNIRKFPEPLKLVFVGKISIEKGCIYLLEAVKKIKNENITLDIIGEIEATQINIFKQYFNVDNINFLGKLPNLKILEILSNYHTFVLPSLTDAYSLAVSEALAHKLPVIITENVGNKEDIYEFKLGEVCKVKDLDSLISSILIFKDENYRQFLISNINNFVEFCQKNTYPSKVLSVYKALEKITV
jgi:glycosyltransferase involved in cell wall biosynthesis